MTKPFLEFDEDAAWERVKEAAEMAGEKLRQSHSWNDRTGDLARAIPVQLTISNDYIDFNISVPYASFVDAKRPYLDDLEDSIDILSADLLDNYLNDIGD